MSSHGNTTHRSVVRIINTKCTVLQPYGDRGMRRIQMVYTLKGVQSVEIDSVSKAAQTWIKWHKSHFEMSSHGNTTHRSVIRIINSKCTVLLPYGDRGMRRRQTVYALKAVQDVEIDSLSKAAQTWIKGHKSHFKTSSHGNTTHPSVVRIINSKCTVLLPYGDRGLRRRQTVYTLKGVQDVEIDSASKAAQT